MVQRGLPYILHRRRIIRLNDRLTEPLLLLLRVAVAELLEPALVSLHGSRHKVSVTELATPHGLVVAPYLLLIVHHFTFNFV